MNATTLKTLSDLLDTFACDYLYSLVEGLDGVDADSPVVGTAVGWVERRGYGMSTEDMAAALNEIIASR